MIDRKLQLISAWIPSQRRGHNPGAMNKEVQFLLGSEKCCREAFDGDRISQIHFLELDRSHALKRSFGLFHGSGQEQRLTHPPAPIARSFQGPVPNILQ